MNKLLNKANVYSPTPFDYAALGDATLEQQARDAAEKIRSLQRGAAVDVGRELLAMKEKLAHGHFDQWVQAEFSWSKSTALNMRRVAKEFGDEYATVAYLPPAVIYQLASPSTPPAVREAVKQVKPGHQVSASSVRLLISDAKSAVLKKERMAERREEEAAEVSRTGLKREERWAKQMEVGAIIEFSFQSTGTDRWDFRDHFCGLIGGRVLRPARKTTRRPSVSEWGGSYSRAPICRLP